MNGTLALTMLVFDGRLAPTPLQRDVIGAYLRRLENGVTVRFSQPRKGRSNSQNRFYWGVVLTLIANETGNDAEDLHSAYKAMFLPRVFITLGAEEVEIPRSTAKLSTGEFNLYMERIRAHAGTELGIKIPLPGEVD